MAQPNSLSNQTQILNQMLNLVETFRAFDSNDDGYISAVELGGILSSLGHSFTEQDLTVMMQQGDRNRDGLLSIEDFLEMTAEKTDMGNLPSILETAFENLDGNGNEDVTASQLFEILENTGLGLSLDACRAIIASIDDDGDGTVSIEDFKLIVNSLC
ncbi:hypothetical protein ACHQM5_022689 [Ranunculus cassubicifolius]